MKTPRELLFERHGSAKPRLDELRKRIVDRIAQNRASFWLKLWQELILPARGAWLGLAGAWMVILALNLVSGTEASRESTESGPMNPESIFALQRQERLMAQLISDDQDSSAPGKASEPPPRSEAPVEYRIL